MAINQKSFYLKSGDEYLSCTALIPEQISGAVLMLPPFAEERKGSLPLLLHIARRVYQNNIASLIFDWRGSGDSSGDFESINPDHYNADLNAALAWLKANTGDVPITALGIRLSAAILLQRDHPAIERVVLISPASGDEFMHQLLQRRMVNDMVAYGKASESRASLLKHLQNGKSVDLDGYIFSAEMYQRISAIRSQESGVRSQESAEIHPQTSTFQHILLISGGHSSKTSREIAAQREFTDILDIRFPPFWNTVGHVDLSQLSAAVTDWIITGFPDDSQPVQSPEFGCQSRDAELIAIAVKESTIRAAIDKPEGEPVAGVLFLAGWSGDRTGPHRLFVQLARRLTREGCLCLRPDFQGRGLSDGEHGEASIASMAEDADVALTELKKRLPVNSPVYVAAICSGCKVAITLAAAHPEINRLLLLSAESMGSLRSSKTDAGKTQTAIRTYLRKLTQMETWKKILSGRVQAKMVTKALVQHESRSADEAKNEDRTLKLFEQYRNPIHFVFGGSDPDAPGSLQAYKAFCEKHSIPHTIYLIPHAGHSYYSAEWTQEVFETSLRFLKN